MSDGLRAIETTNRQGIGLRLQASWVADRFHHEILLVTPQAVQPLLKSREGTPEDDWPASPPCQDLSSQQIDGHPAMLGVGMAGRSHWSVSLMATSAGDQLALECDIACLARETPDQPLGSLYRLESSARQADDRVMLAPAGQDGQHVFVACDGPGSQGGQLQLMPEQLSIRPSEPVLTPGTVQWKYRVWIE